MSPATNTHYPNAWRALLLAAIVVGGVTCAVIWSVANRADDTSRGLVKTSCALVKTIDQGVRTQERSVQVGRELIRKLPKDDPTRATRQRNVKAAEKQAVALRKLAVEMRKGITCPRPRV